MNSFDMNLLNEIMESDKFSSEEKDILNKRFIRHLELEKLYAKLDTCTSKEDYYNLLDEIMADVSDECEHERHYASGCAACFEMEKKIANLHPEVYRDDPEYKDNPDYQAYFEE